MDVSYQRGVQVRVAHAVVGAAQVFHLGPMPPVTQALRDEPPVGGPRKTKPVELDKAVPTQGG